MSPLGSLIDRGEQRARRLVVPTGIPHVGRVSVVVLDGAQMLCLPQVRPL